MSGIVITERVRAFDEQASCVTQVRGNEYPHPYVDFARVAQMKAQVQACEHVEARHVMEMILVKIGRLVENPGHLDCWVDIAGYARCGVIVTDSPTDQGVAEVIKNIYTV